MSAIKICSGIYECDTPGCPVEFSISRWLYDNDQDGDLSEAELRMYAVKLGWTLSVKNDKAFCPDCQRNATAKASR